MNRKIYGYMASLALLITACSSNTSDNKVADNSASTADTSSLPPVETKDPNTNYKSAFAGQTRIGGVKTTTAYGATVLTNDLKNPWGIKSLPDGRFLVTEREGNMRIVGTDGKIGEPIAGIPEVNSKGQGGLLGLALDPDFESNRMVYWSFSESRPGGNLTSVAKGKLSADEKKMENVAVIYRAEPAFNSNLHYGSRIVFDKNGDMFVSTGERSDIKSRPQAQHLNSALGKVLHITKEGKPASGNPLASQAGARPEIYTYGHRNIQSLAMHPETGELWEAEFGPRGGDELNRIEAGKNYGWPTITYGIEYSGEKIGDAIQQKEGMEQPVYYWDPVISPSGMTFYNGDNMPEWKNNLFIGALSGMHIARIVIKDNKVVGEERLLSEENQRFRDVTQGKDGVLYAVTDGGRLYKIAKK